MTEVATTDYSFAALDPVNGRGELRAAGFGIQDLALGCRVCVTGLGTIGLCVGFVFLGEMSTAWDRP